MPWRSDTDRGHVLAHTSPERWLDEHGDVLFGFAYLRVRDRDAAEDLVQETLLAAWRARASFAAGSSERTWLVGILKHKLADHWRRQAREQRHVAAHASDAPDAALLDALFDEDRRGHWRTPPSPWSDPDAALETREFWRVFTECVAALPPAQARAFGLCELDGLKGEEACKVLGVAATNLWVMLHRARLRLRACLERNWFLPDQKE